MAGKSQYLENALMNWMKGSAFPTAPATVWVALFTTAPTNDAGASAVEATGGSYARAAITTTTQFSVITGAPGAPAQISNSGVVTFATPTVSWGTILAIGIYDAVTAGNLLYWATITSQAIGIGVVASFAANQLIITDD